MKIKNLKVNKEAVVALSLCTVLTLSGCGNKQVFDFNKSFNVAIEKNDNIVSVVAIKEYSDYEGSQVQFVTEDGLRVVTSTMQTQLLKVQSEDSLNQYVYALSGENMENIVDYNQMQGVEVDYSVDNWNKDILDLHFTYNKAIILSDGTATIIKLSAWKDYEDDDKVQLKLLDGTCILTNADKVKLINDEDAKEDSLKNYALSLVGDSEKVVFYDYNNSYSR